jgi:hypothetical protein
VELTQKIAIYSEENGQFIVPIHQNATTKNIVVTIEIQFRVNPIWPFKAVFFASDPIGIRHPPIVKSGKTLNKLLKL